MGSVREVTTEQSRPQTDIDRIAEAHLDAEAALSPITATYLGLPGHDAEIDDLSPDGFAAASRLRRETLATLDRATPVDDNRTCKGTQPLSRTAPPKPMPTI